MDIKSLPTDEIAFFAKSQINRSTLTFYNDILFASGGCPAAEEHPHGDAAARSSGVNSSFDWLLDVSASCHRETTPEPPQVLVQVQLPFLGSLYPHAPFVMCHSIILVNENALKKTTQILGKCPIVFVFVNELNT